jgi:hypothetical protein
LTQRLLDQGFPFSSYIYGYPSDTLSRDAIATTSCITICCIAFIALKEVASSFVSWSQRGGVALATSSPGRYGTHPCTAVLPRLIQVHHQFPRLAPRCEVLVSLMSTRPVACKGGCFTAARSHSSLTTRPHCHGLRSWMVWRWVTRSPTIWIELSRIHAREMERNRFGTGWRSQDGGGIGARAARDLNDISS